MSEERNDLGGYSPLDGGGRQNTELHCHACHKTFVARIDFDVTGNHVLECAHCGHKHYRWIENGVVTDKRWDSDAAPAGQVTKASTWKSSVIAADTSTVSSLLRERWLNRSDVSL